jgi:anti-sigma B factor antagonist
MAKEVFRILQEQSVGILEFRTRPDSDAMALDVLMESIVAEFESRNVTAWVLDLSAVGFLNSAGLGLLVNIRQKVRQSRGKLALCGLSTGLMELFRSCCLERLFTIEKTREDAVAAVS